MDTRKRGSTSEMQVTSIRLEPELKERLREISGEQGYQTLIREILWQLVDQQMVSDEVRWHSLSKGESYSVENRRSPSHPHCYPCRIFGRRLEQSLNKKSNVPLQGSVFNHSKRWC
jgi:hypothetical protein